MLNTVTIEGVPYPIHFGYAALMKFETKFNVSIAKLNFEELGIITSMRIIWCGFADGHRIAKKRGEIPKTEKFTLEVEDIADFIDTDQSLLTSLMDQFTASLAPAETETETEKLDSVGKSKPKAQA